MEFLEELNREPQAHEVYIQALGSPRRHSWASRGLRHAELAVRTPEHHTFHKHSHIVFFSLLLISLTFIMSFTLNFIINRTINFLTNFTINLID